MPESWDEFLCARLCALEIDADVFAPYVTGLLEDASLPVEERDSSVRELLCEASPSGSVAEGTVAELSARWEEQLCARSAAATAASAAVLESYASEAAARKASDVRAAVLRTQNEVRRATLAATPPAGPLSQRTLCAWAREPPGSPLTHRSRLQEALLEKRRLMAQLDAGASSSDSEEEPDEEAADERRATADVARAREEQRQRVEQRREAISRAAEREEKKRVEHDLRRAVREQAGHTTSPPAKGKKAAKS